MDSCLRGTALAMEDALSSPNAQTVHCVRGSNFGAMLKCTIVQRKNVAVPCKQKARKAGAHHTSSRAHASWPSSRNV
jgi:hypothetical protein